MMAKKKQHKQPKIQIKKHLRQMVYGFYMISTVFLLLLLVSMSFLLYQWKNYKITEYVKEIQQLKTEVLKLESEVSYNQGKINTKLLKYHHIAKIANQKLDLRPSIRKPRILKVDKNKLGDYVARDQEEKK